MSLPPGFLDEIRSRLALSDVAGRKVAWDRRRSNPGRGDWWAPCPFHQEKTASFHVDDRKGYFYCFGCQAKGDLIDFVRETENVDFMGAVEMLAREAGLEMPAAGRDPRAAERRDRMARLADIMEEAVRAYGRAFRSAAGQVARDYARGRGLSEATLKRFEIGFAPAERHFLSGPFREKGLLDDAVTAGLVIVPEDGGAPFDRFRNRLMFPIRDPSGRCIAFGGRAMSPEARAKYLNSPETELFHKGRTLYNHGPAREAAGKGGAKACGLIVAEGYMDVIALVQAGFEHAVAPLGTAVTEEQLGLLWRMADEPVIALDGDRAGLAAAERLVDMALPLLAPGRSLGFCLLPEGQDPDDLIRTGGAPAMAAALASALPMVEMLWRRETGRAPLDTPERRAALDKRLREALGRIADPGVRNHYAAELRTRRAALLRPAPRAFGPRRPWSGPGARAGRLPAAPARPARETLGSDLARRAAARDAARIRESAILLIALRHPEALAPVESALESMTCTAPGTARIRDALLDALHDGEGAVGVGVARRLAGADPVAELEKVPQARAHPMARPGHDAQAVALVLREAIQRHQTQLSHALEIAEARRELADAEDEAWTARLRQANLERMAADSEAVARLAEADDRSEESVFQRMLDAELWRRRKKP